MTLRFRSALLAFSALAILAFVTLRGNIRLVVLIVLGGFALKTWIEELRRRQENK